MYEKFAFKKVNLQEYFRVPVYKVVIPLLAQNGGGTSYKVQKMGTISYKLN